MNIARLKYPATRCFKFLGTGSYYIQAANVTSRSSRGRPLQLQTPFPYNEKKFTFWNGLFDNTMLRVGAENAKIIVIEGPIACGKSAFGQVLAEELDMLFMPQPNMDELYVLPDGYDLRQHDHELPKIVQSYDHRNFCLEPKDFRSRFYQLLMLSFRFFQYVDALAHILNTGQGVVLERSYLSDYVFMEAMVENKYVPRAVKDFYYYKTTVPYSILPKPHLVIYLDLPVPVVQERIRTRNYSYEQKSPALTNEYLSSLEKFWKLDYLKKASEKSEVLVYNWVNGGDVELLLEDIEKLNLNITNPKYEGWRLVRKELFYLRQKVTNDKLDFLRFFKLSAFETPELTFPVMALIKKNEILKKVLGLRYDIGYDPSIGFWKLLFKTHEEDHRNLRLHLYFDDADHTAS